MSRSYRKTPVFGMCGSQRGQKQDKQIANRNFRRVNKVISHQNTMEFNTISTHHWIDMFDGLLDLSIEIDRFDYLNRMREASNVWDWRYDGKNYDGNIIYKEDPKYWWKRMSK